MEHDLLNKKLQYFIKTKQIPNIIFHGETGSGKRTIVNQFLLDIYSNKTILKSNVMIVNCSHGKGIKFIREDLKFFAKTNISSNKNALFKSIVLLNADTLTIDAQSALRRCIEVFCNNTRFFIIVENKHKLLIPIISRFCEIYVPRFSNIHYELPINLHEENIKINYQSNEAYNKNNIELQQIIKEFTLLNDFSPINIIKLSNNLYDKGFAVKHIVDSIVLITMPIEKDLFVLCYHKLKSDFRCEKMFFFYMLELMFMGSNEDIKDMLLI